MAASWPVRFVHNADLEPLLKSGEELWEASTIERLTKTLGYVPWREFQDYGDSDDAPPLGFFTHCPICFGIGSILVRSHPNHPGHAVWQWNGSWERPTLSPSVAYSGGCGFHCWVRDGWIVDENSPPHSLGSTTR